MGSPCPSLCMCVRSGSEVTTGHAHDFIKERAKAMFCLKAVSNLDEESKFTVHYTAPWHQQENVFLPTSRPACVEELHRQAKVNLKTALRECDKLRKDGFRSSQYYSQGPTFSGSGHSSSSQQEDEDAEDDEADNKSTASSAEEEKSSNPMTAQAPVQGEESEVDGQESSLKAPPLPTPEEKMRQQAQAVLTDIVPINVTGETFDRQASVRRSLINTDTLAHRPKKVKRRKTISGLPDNFQEELAAKGRGGELRPQSMFIPGQYSTLGRSGSVSSTLRRSGTRDSGCQTEEVKIVPPSMRRIRAQRGQGIAAQMAGISTSATNISTVSDGHSAGSPTHVMPPCFNGDAQRFHSLPRGARVSLNAEPLYSSTPCRPEDSTATPRQIGKLQADETVVHMRNIPRVSTPTRPKSQEIRSSQGDWGTITGPACVVSPHATYSTSLIPNATLSCSAEVIALHTTANPGQQLLARPLSIASNVNGESSTSLATTTDIAEADMQEMGQSDSSLHSQSTIAAASSDEQWIYDTPENVLPRRTLTSSCSTPINHLYNSFEQSSKGTDSSSLYSMDNDGYYTSMHLDSGLRPKSHSITGRATRHSMYECLGAPGDRSSLYSDRSLSRSISLRKSKKPPLPPARTDSLRRKPKNLSGAHGMVQGSNGSVLNESLIATLQQSLQNGLKAKGSSTSPSQSPCSDYEDPWMLRPRSQSSVSGGSSGMSAVGVTNVYSICHVTPSHSDTSSLRSDYAESWGYYMDYPHTNNNQTQSPPRTNSVSSGGQSGGQADGPSLLSGTQTAIVPAPGDVSVKPQANTSSPDRVHRLTSPSSGYSSQSNTPTAGTPVPSFMRSMSPSGCKPRPRVPERKSSLLSSVSISSSSTSLSSNTSDSAKNNIPPPPPPLPPSSTSVSPLSPQFFLPPLLPSSPVCSTSQTFPPPPAPPLPSTPHQEASMSPMFLNSSPEFPPPPPPEVLHDHSMLLNSSFSPPPPPPPPPFPTVSAYAHPVSPCMPNMIPVIPSSASLKGIKDGLKPVNSERRSATTHSEESGKSGMPLITAFALQSVQLRSVKRPENGEADGSKSQEMDTDQVTTKTWSSMKFRKEHPTVLPLVSCSAPDINGVVSPSTPETEQSHKPVTSRGATDNNPSEATYKEEPEQTYHQSDSIDLAQVPAVVESDDSESVSSASSRNTTPKKKPPVVSKKPKLPISVSSPALRFAAEEKQTLANSGDALELLNLQTEGSFSDDGTEGQVPPSVQEHEKENGKSNTGSFVSSTELRDFESSILPSDSQTGETSQTLVPEETVVDSVGEVEDDGEDDDGASSTAESVSSKDDENGEVFESSAADSSPAASTNGEVFEDMVTPTRPRTTEDLFAAIHRSKRKVLGRKESEDDRSRAQPSSPPVTPTGACPTLGSSLPRQTGSIQRSLRKSATSSDSFKALLLKKGSRSETSFRMSAAEMLRSTDPRFQRARSLDSSLDPSLPSSPDSPCASPSRSKRASEDWARSEGIIPRYSLGSPSSASPSSLMGPKYGRSRTPPSAASSKYNARSRILSSPMTVICEREGELAESGEGWDESCPDSPVTPAAQLVAQDSNGTLCEEESS